MALRARLVGGRPSPLCSLLGPGPGDGLGRTVPAVLDLAVLVRREADGELVGRIGGLLLGSSAMNGGYWVDDWR